MLKLMNSAMMPQEGNYSMRQISADEFAEILRTEPFESYIGYPDNLKIIKELSGVDVPLSREQTRLAPGDEMLVMRLKYRITNPADKGKFTPTVDDFEFFKCEYR